MSKWIKKDKADLFIKQKQEEAANPPEGIGGGYALKWPNPKMGSETQAKEYRIRFLPDKNGDFYKKYFYHFVTDGEGKGKYVLCPKTFGMEEYCPWCSAVQLLFKGNDTDKSKASDLKRKVKFVSNIYVANDPRDTEVKDDNWKQSGKIRLYEFPSLVESKIKDELTDTDEGYGISIFDPENGYDLLLKVRAKPKDKNGKIWPDYSDTKFARSSGPVSENVEEVMKEVYDLNEYLNRMQLSWDEHKKLLKEALIFEDVEDEFHEKTRKQAENKLDELPWEEDRKDETSNEEPVKTPEKKEDPSVDEEESDEDIMAELQGMMGD